MSDVVTVGIVGAAAALIGASIGTGGQLLLARGEREHGRRVRLEDERRAVYSELLRILLGVPDIMRNVVGGRFSPELAATVASLTQRITDADAALTLCAPREVIVASHDSRDAWTTFVTECASLLPTDVAHLAEFDQAEADRQLVAIYDRTLRPAIRALINAMRVSIGHKADFPMDSRNPSDLL